MNEPIVSPWIFVSVPLFGDSFFIKEMKLSPQCGEIEFPSPYSGILFLCDYIALQGSMTEEGFPSPYSGILFLLDTPCGHVHLFQAVSDPLFGDSFFILSL